jgi:hypothetical protein
MAKRNVIASLSVIVFGLLGCCLAVPLALATEKKVDTAKENPAVLDFEADIIEGERKNPQLFLQLGSTTPDLNTVLYMREDFNDFHNIEKKRKPRYQTRRQSGKK